MKAYVINRAVDPHRLNNVLLQATRAQGMELERVEAVDGHAGDFDPRPAFPEVMAKNFPLPADKEDRARIAIFLSHLACWRRIAQGPDDYALILEDDCLLEPEIGATGDKLPPTDAFDLVFCNERMVNYRSHLPEDRNKGLVSVDEMHKYYAQNLPEDRFERTRVNPNGILKTATGGEGYILSRRGAEKLLESVRNARFLPHVDSFLYVSCVNRRTFAEHANTPRVSGTVNGYFPGREDLRGFILETPVVRTDPRSLGGSVRRRAGVTAAGPRPAASGVRVVRDPADRVILHLGFHKTGTTFLQEFLLENQRALGHHFVLLNQKIRTSSPLARAAQALHRRMIQNKKTDRFAEEIRREAGNVRDLARALGKGVVVSDEEIAGYLPGRGPFLSLYPALPVIARTLLEGFAPMDVTFVLYTRELEAWARSSYNQCVKSHGFSRSLEDYRREVLGDQTLEACVAAVREAVGRERVVALGYEEEAARSLGIVESFCEVLGIERSDLAGLALPERSNESLPKGALEFMRRLNGKNLDGDTIRIFRSLVRDNADLFRQDVTLEGPADA